MYGQLFEHAFIPRKHINPYLKAKNAIKKYESSLIVSFREPIQRKIGPQAQFIPLLSALKVAGVGAESKPSVRGRRRNPRDPDDGTAYIKEKIA
jgi:hypothetical protein